ncbi:hypothetical protein ACFW1L_24145, partial [Streptomyces olivaceus]|uniref:hypothetical protein n=1 Tax=Streptomyces olivaceus TaxID=47716 RepID=UPI0036746E01
MSGAAHQRERLAGPPHVPHSEGQARQHAALEEPDHLAQHLPHAVRTRFHEVERPVRHALVGRGHLTRIPYVRLP